MKLRCLALLCAALTACSGGTAAPIAPTPIPTSASGLVSTSFTFAAPKTGSARRGQYLTSSVQSVTITLNTVNGSAPPAGLTAGVTSNISLSSCPCTVPGPSVPPGSDTFTITTYDAQNGGGSVVSTASANFTITPGTANNNTVTLDGVPARLTISGVPAATAGTAFSTAQPFTVTVKDADGNTIVGAYANPVTLSDSDTSGATALTTGQLWSSSDTAALSYTGRAIAPATLSASASGATSGTASFAPVLQPIAYSGPLYAGNPEIDLYTTSGTGSTGTFTASETGLTGAPYNASLSISLASGCSSIATATPSSGTSFTVTVASAPAVGSCTLTISDGLGQTKNVTLTYTTSAFGVQ